MNNKEENMKKNSFLLYIDKREIVETLTDEQAGKVFKAIYKYVDTKEESQLDPVSKIVFMVFRQMLDANEEKYMNIVERNRKNGLRGGRPKKTENQKNPKNPVGYLENPNKPKKADTETDTDTENDNDNEINKKKETKKKFGNYQQVKLTNKELQSLKSDYGDDLTNQLITYLDEYIEMKGYKAKSHYLCIKKWVVNAVEEQKQKKLKQQIVRKAPNEPVECNDPEFLKEREELQRTLNQAYAPKENSLERFSRQLDEYAKNYEEKERLKKEQNDK